MNAPAPLVVFALSPDAPVAVALTAEALALAPSPGYVPVDWRRPIARDRRTRSWQSLALEALGGRS